LEQVLQIMANGDGCTSRWCRRLNVRRLATVAVIHTAAPARTSGLLTTTRHYGIFLSTFTLTNADASARPTGLAEEDEGSRAPLPRLLDGSDGALALLLSSFLAHLRRVLLAQATCVRLRDASLIIRDPLQV
jgi:hypothetical protein